MGKGRKSKKLQPKKNSQVPWTVNMSGTARNLTKDKLGGIIFGCKNHTISECLNNQLFGLPASHHSYVKNVRPGLPLYLFNYSDRTLHGIFEAVSTGQMNLNPHAWAATEGVERTPYPSQVRVRERKKCRPLLEREFEPIIENNYYKERHFWFELDHEQNQRLVNLFLSSSFPEKMLPLPNAARENVTLDVFSRINVDKNEVKKLKCREAEEYSVAKVSLREEKNSHTIAPSASEKKWSDLLKPSSSSCGVKNEESLEYQNVGLKSSRTDYSHNMWRFTPSSDAWSEQPDEACLDDSDACAVDNWEDNISDNVGMEINENKFTCLQYCDPENGRPDQTETSSENINVLDEVGELMPLEVDCPLADRKGLIDTKENVRPVTDLVTVENCERNQDQLNLTETTIHEDCNALPAVMLTDVQPSDYQRVIATLMQEVGVLKVSHVKQRLRIESLEHELVHSKVEIDQLRSNQKLESVLSTNYNSADCASPNLKPEESVYIVGGFDGCSWLSDVSLYSPSTDRVVSLCPMTITRPYASLAKLNGELYIFGGALGKVWYNTVESYNPINNQWVQQPCLNRKKGCMAGASMYETLFAIGGSNGDESLSEVELFDLHIESWVTTQPMLEKRSSPAAVDLNGVLYVSGGYDGRGFLRSVERLDLRTHSWAKLGRMNKKRQCHSLVAFNEKLYALGGCATGSSVEVYDPRMDSWMMAEPMKVSRKSFGSFVLEGRIYVIGGMQDSQVLDLVECYSEDCGWQVTGATSLGKRSFVSALVL